MPQAAKLTAHNFIPANLGCGEVKLEIQSWHEILMNSQSRNIEGVADIFGVHQQTDFTVNRNGHFGAHDIVLGVRIVVGIETVEILVGLADHIGVNWTKCSIWPRIAEIECELPGLDLDGHGACTGLCEVDISPG